MSINNIEKMRSFLYRPPPKPKNSNTKLFSQGSVLGVWNSACLNAIFEISFHCGEKAIPFLEKISFGVYDWSQYMALGVLIRFAKNNIKTNEIMLKISKHLPEFNDITLDSIFDEMNYFPKKLSDEVVMNFFNFADESGYLLEIAKVIKFSNLELVKKLLEEWIQEYKEIKIKDIKSIEEIVELAIFFEDEKWFDEYIQNCIQNILQTKSYDESLQILTLGVFKNPEKLKKLQMN
jgi:hypothetical protein